MIEDKFKTIIFENKSLSDIFADIYRNSKHKKKRINILLNNLKNMINDTNTAIILLPILKDLLEIGIKNDEQLIKMASVSQKLISSSRNSLENETIEILTEEEKKQLLESFNSSIKDDEFNIDEQLKLLNEKIELSKKEIENVNKKSIEELNG